MYKLFTHIILLGSFLENVSASHLIQDEKQASASSHHNFDEGIKFFTSPTDSPEYTAYIKKFPSGSFTFKFNSPDDAPCLALVPFLKKREISPFKTLLELPRTGPFSAPKEYVQYFVEYYRKYYFQNTDINADMRADVLECAGTFYINRQEYDFAFHLYDHVQAIGTLSPDGLYNYIIHSLQERASNYTSVKKAWQMLQDWQKQFDGTPATSRITKTDINLNPEIICLLEGYKVLFQTITNHPQYYPVLEEIMDFRIKEETPSITNISISDAFFLMLKRTMFADYRVGQPVRRGGDDYEKVIQKNLIRFNIEHYNGPQLLQSVVTENIKAILQKDPSIRNFLKERFKKSFDPQHITLNQYLTWARRIINSHRNDLLSYAGKSQFILEKIIEIDNVELENVVSSALNKSF